MSSGRTLPVATVAVVLLASALAGVAPVAGAPPDGRTATVTDVVDGDTVRVRLANGSLETVRLIGVDTPETSGPNTPDEFGLPETDAAREFLHAQGENATRFTEARLVGETVRLVSDPEADDRGYFGRLLRYVVVDGESVNEQLVVAGHARVYESSFTNRSRYRDLEATARAAGRGVWGYEGLVRPAANASLVVSATQFDAPGREYENLDRETVTLRNAGAEPLALAGWRVRDAVGHEYTFGDRTLAPGATVTLATGHGNDTDATVYWGRDAPVWNNDGDRVVVLAPDDTTVQNATVTAGGHRTCRGPVPAVDAGLAPPNDLDCDGLHEDVDGDGGVSIADVVSLAFALGGDVVETVGWAFDFRPDGRVTFADVVDLAFRL